MSSPRIPLVVGVVGHLDPNPAGEPKIVETVQKILRHLRTQFPNSPIEILSSVAAGADQLVVAAALDLKDPEITVRAPLPFPADTYFGSSSFPMPAAQAQAEGWIKDGRVTPFVVPQLGGPDPDSTDPAAVAAWARIRDDAASRRACYANAGGYTVRHSLVLIALWDGAPAAKLSGTAEMVEFKLRGTVPEAMRGREPLQHGAETGPVLVVHTPRADADATTAGALKVLVPDGERVEKGKAYAVVPQELVFRSVTTWRRFRWRVASALGSADWRSAESQYLSALEGVHNLDDFNRDVLRGGEPLRKNAAAGATKMLKRDEQEESGKKTRTDAERARWVSLGTLAPLKRLAEIRAAAAELANGLEVKLKWLQRGVFGSFLVALLFFHFYSHPSKDGGGHWPGWLLFFLLGLLLSGGLVGFAWFRRMDLRRLDYRVVAEAIRVRYFWGLVGIDKSVADAYLGQLRGEMAWARRALQMISPPSAEWKRLFDRRSDAERAECLACAGERWVSEQRRYFDKAKHRMHTKARRLRRAGLALAGLGWGVALVLLVSWCVGGHGEEHAPLDARHPAGWVMILSPMLVIAGAFVVAYCERRAHESLSRQYAGMKSVCAEAEYELAAAVGRPSKDWGAAASRSPDVPAAQLVLAALGREALVEHVNWLSIRRARPIELVMG